MSQLNLVQVQKPLQIVICGGGNGAHATAGWVGAKSWAKVNVFTRRPQDWKSEIQVITKGGAWEHKGTIVGKLNKVSSDPKDLCEGTTFWIICGPAHVHSILLKQIAPFVSANSFVGTLFAQGGFDWAAKEIFGQRLVEENITLFGLYNIPWLCKADVYGEKVRIIGPKESLAVATIPQQKEFEVIRILEELYDIPTQGVPNFLSLTLTPSNQIIHPGRVYGLFKDWDGKTPYKTIPLFYEDLDEFSAAQLLLLDNEIQSIKREINKKYPAYDLRIVIPLKDRIKVQYGDQVKDNTNIYTTFRTNQGYTTITIPSLPAPGGGYVLNTKARIFWEDVPYGLCILHDLAKMLNLRTPAIDKMILWHQQFMDGKKFILNNGELNPELINETGTPRRYGFTTIEQVLGIQPISPKL